MTCKTSTHAKTHALSMAKAHAGSIMATPGAAPPAAPIPAGYVPFTYVPAQSDHLSNGRHWPPYQPLSHMSQHEMDLRAAKGVYEHFHVPWNTNSKYLSSVNKADLAACRDIPRRTPPPFDQAGLVPASSIRPSTSDGILRHEDGQIPYGQQQLRPQSASPTKKQLVRERVKQMEYAEAARRLMVTQTGVPCYTTSALVSADLEQGAPLDGPLPEPEAWRESRVQTYALLPSQSGWAEGGVRPFHQDYRHYKYFGFAGKGGKTSWAYNPKYVRFALLWCCLNDTLKTTVEPLEQVLETNTRVPFQYLRYKYLQTYQSMIRGDADADPPDVLSGHIEVGPRLKGRVLTPCKGASP
ncbi:hypothetical protein DUNSADRAFT_11993 [Dunaliella salina]|uniref:Uncharacterized protein n=1 Tax=Dunaliella salina TaxID=3046 RepID=A0ABQ7GC76_DUNSA|nr:hypothetical protein DUNSADRAFT_11993 [Dunaliella salina]|eukprot:KAF5832209.1 hypothetical protein DUNSADRAFT_11993 [Dunaliella salina]